MKCDKCSRHKTRKRIVRPELHYKGDRPDILALGESPGENEDNEGKPFIGRAGDTLRAVVGQVTDDFIFDNSVRCYSDNKPSSKQLKQCKPNWMSVVSRYKPKVIVALGNYAAESILGKKIKISNWVGHSISIDVDGEQYPVIFNYHPSFIIRSEKNEDYGIIMTKWCDAWESIQDAIENGIQGYPETCSSTDTNKIMTVLKHLYEDISPEDMSYDYEAWGDKGALRPELCDNFRILCVGIGLKDELNFSFPFDSMDEFAPKEIEKLWKKIIGREGSIAQNCKYEHKANIKRFGFTSYLKDTMLAMTTINELASADLGSIGKYCNIPWSGYKIAMSSIQKNPADTPIPELLKYSALDGLMTFDSWQVLWKQIKTNELKKVLHIQQKIAYHLAYVEFNGMHIDQEVAVEVRDEIIRELEDARNEFYKLKEIKKVERWAINNIKSFKSGNHFNPDSSVQMHHLCLDILKLKVPPAKKKLKNGSWVEGTVCLDKLVLEKFEIKYPVIEHLLKVRSLSSMLSGFLNKYEDFTGPDGCVHTNYTQEVVVTGRLSSTAPNLQNIPLESPVRRPFSSRFDDGWVVAADYSQIEPIILAGWSGDPLMCKAINEGKDLHRFVGSIIYGVDYDLVTDKQRYIAKRRNLGSMYGQTAEGLAECTGLSIDEAKEIVNIYNKTFIVTYQFRMDRGKEAIKFGMVKDLFGSIRHLPNAQSSNMMVRERALRQAGNFPIQSTGNKFHLISMCILRGYFISYKLQSVVIGVEHDKILLDCPNDELKIAIKLTKKAMLIHNYMDYWKDKPVKIKVDIKYGRNLHEMYKYI